MLHALIMAGGSGTRFWPSSTKKRPKQFLEIFGDRTMLQQTFDRIEPIIPAKRVWVITNEDYVDLVRKQLPGVPFSNIVGEPIARNTAPCVALAAALISRKDPDGTMVVLPADHHITQPDRFRSILATASSKAGKEDALVTIGIKPTRPETGYGYIESLPAKKESPNAPPVLEVRQFREKPDEETARSFLEAGHFLWNSGMFSWRTDTIIDRFNQHLPEVYRQIEVFLESEGTDDDIRTFYEGCPSISIDFGIMEKSSNVYVVPGSFGWNDVGSWRAVYDLREKDKMGNVREASCLQLHKAKNNLVKSGSEKIFALVGVENLAIVETDKAFLVCNLDEAQGVKQIVEQLRANDELNEFL